MALFTAWHTELFARMKKLPPLDTLLEKMRTRQQPQTAGQPWQEVRAMMAAQRAALAKAGPVPAPKRRRKG